MSKELSDNVSEVQESIQPEKTFDKHVASLIDDFKSKVPGHVDVIVIVKPNESEPPMVYMKGHIYDIAVMAAEFVRELKHQIGNQLEC